MRDWIKGILGGGSSGPAPEGVPEAWIKELRRNLDDGYVIGGNNLSGGDLSAAVEYVLRGTTGTWIHPKPLRNPNNWIQYRQDPLPAQPAFYLAFPQIPGEILLRWAQVLEAMAFLNHYQQFHIPFPGGVHWPELILIHGGGARLYTPPPSIGQLIEYRTIEKMLVAAGMAPEALLVGAFATPVDSGYGAEERLAAVMHCPDFADALERHADSVRLHLVSGSAAQRAHVLKLISKARPNTLDKLAPELAQLAVASSKQVRMAAESFVQSAGAGMVTELRRVATEGKPEQRLFALRHLHERARRAIDPALKDFARTTAAADKAESVQALIVEWDAAMTADEVPEAKYDFVTPVIDWNTEPDAHVSARLGKLIDDLNAQIRAQNQQARDHYESWTREHGKPKWKLSLEDEYPPGRRKEIERALRAGPPSLGKKPRHPHRGWASVPIFHALATDRDLKPTQLFKVLYEFGLLLDHRDAINHVACDCFNRHYAAAGKPSLIELAQMFADMGVDSGRVLAAYCSNSESLGRDWRAEDVWPFIAANIAAVERYLIGGTSTDYWFDRERLYDAIASLPVPPPRLVNALYSVALGQGKSERVLAQQALAQHPGKEARIIAALSDGKSEVRMVAAQWLGRLKHAPAVNALAKAVAAEKHDTAKGSMLDALQALGEPVDKYLKRDSLLPEAKKALAKPLPKDLEWMPWDSLPEVRWSDNGEAVPHEVLKWMLAQACRAKNPEPNAVLRKYCAMFEPRDRERFGQWVLDQWLREDIAPISPEDAKNQAQSHAQSLHGYIKSHPQYHQNSPYLGKSVAEIFASLLPGCLRQPKGSAIASKGVLAVAAACAAERAGAPVQRYIKEYYGTRAAQGKALITMLAWIDHPGATQVMLAIGNRFRTKSIQEEASRQAEALAERRGWTMAELSDRTIPSAGFDEDGVLELSYGERMFSAKLLPDFKIELANPEGKKIASLPEPRQDENADLAADAKKALGAAKKEIKAVVALQTDRLYEALCTGREWPYADWNDYLNQHPVVRHLVQRMVWLQWADERAVTVFRPLDDGMLTNADDEAVTLPDDARIRVAHDSLLSADDVKKWQQHLVDYEIQPLFTQLGKGTYELPESLGKAKEILDFRGHLLESYALRGKANKLGYQRSQAEDGGWFHYYEKRFPTLGITAAVQFTGSPLPEENRTVALLGLSFFGSEATNTWERSGILLSRVPKVLLSECYNDLRLLAAEGTGFDPQWEKKSAY